MRTPIPGGLALGSFLRYVRSQGVAIVAILAALGPAAGASAVMWTGATTVNGSLTGADVAEYSLAGAEIQAGSISSQDLAPGALARVGRS